MFFFFFNDPATTEIYPLSLHDALPISRLAVQIEERAGVRHGDRSGREGHARGRRRRRRADGQSRDEHQSRADRKSTRLNSSHLGISYAVFCLKKKKATPAHAMILAHTS